MRDFGPIFLRLAQILSKRNVKTMCFEICLLQILIASSLYQILFPKKKRCIFAMILLTDELSDILAQIAKVHLC